MKVLYLISGVGPPAGWGTEYIQNLIFELSRKGIEATIINPIYLHTHPSWKNWIQEKNAKFGARIIPIEVPNWISKNLIFHLIITPFLVTYFSCQLLRKEKFDLIHDFSSTPIILFRALIFQFIFQSPTIFTLSVYNNTFLGNLFWFRLFDFAKFYLIPSKEVISKIIDIGVKKNKLIYAPPGMNLTLFSKPINKLVARKKLDNLPINKFIIVFFGSLTEEKGVGDLIKAAKILQKQFTGNIFFSIFAIWKGSTEHRSIKEEIEKMDSNYMKLYEKYVEIPIVIAASDLVVLPQQTGHGATIPIISVVETLAAKKLLIATNILGNKELINTSNGILIPPKKPLILANTIKEAYLNNKISKGTPTLKQFEMEKSVQLHLSIYTNAVKKINSK